MSFSSRVEGFHWVAFPMTRTLLSHGPWSPMSSGHPNQGHPTSPPLPPTRSIPNRIWGRGFSVPRWRDPQIAMTIQVGHVDGRAISIGIWRALSTGGRWSPSAHSQMGRKLCPAGRRCWSLLSKKRLHLQNRGVKARRESTGIAGRVGRVDAI